MNELPKSVAKRVRAEAGATGKPYPIEVIGGDKEPVLEGRGPHYITPGGKPVYYPSAYRRAWGKPVYVSSTLRIEVGLSWLVNNGLLPAPDLETDWRPNETISEDHYAAN